MSDVLLIGKSEGHQLFKRAFKCVFEFSIRNSLEDMIFKGLLEEKTLKASNVARTFVDESIHIVSKEAIKN